MEEKKAEGGWVDAALAKLSTAELSPEDTIFVKKVTKRRQPDEDGDRDDSLDGKTIQRLKVLAESVA